MDKKKYWIMRLFLAIFTLSVSVTVIPCGIINAHGLFGEVVASAITEDKDQTMAIETAKSVRKLQQVKGMNIFYPWFEFLMAVQCICFLANLAKLPQEDTIITLKVRMNN